MAFFNIFDYFFTATWEYHLFVQQLGVIFWELKRSRSELKEKFDSSFRPFQAFWGANIQWQNVNARQAKVFHTFSWLINQDLPRFRLWRLNYAIVSLSIWLNTIRGSISVSMKYLIEQCFDMDILINWINFQRNSGFFFVKSWCLLVVLEFTLVLITA